MYRSMQVSIVFLLLDGVVANDIGVRRHHAVAANGGNMAVQAASVVEVELEDPVRKHQKQDNLDATNAGAHSFPSSTAGSPNRAVGKDASGSSDSASGNGIFGVLANYGWNSFSAEDESFNSAAVLICSARFKGSKSPFHLIYGGGEPQAHLSVLTTLGWTVEDHQSDLPFWRAHYKPIYNESSAKEQGRRWVENNRVQKRRDGWLTYLKFHAWQAVQYEHVMLVDLDVQFQANPDNGFDKIGSDVDFLASPEKTPNGEYSGLNTHLSILRPSFSTFEKLVYKAQQGDYVPRTNTEQDIIEDVYSPANVTTDMRRLFPHVHRDYTILRKKCVHDWTSNLLTAATPSCNALKVKCDGNLFK